jgi:hypothetical protein
MKKIPKGIMHEPKVMAWAEATPLSEHKEREKQGVQIDIIPSDTKKIEPLPLSRATTELRRAYPYIFDCAAYVLTHSPERIETDLFYSRFTMPYHVFLNYCLDYCTEQTQYLKEELYRLLKGQPAKYIKVSKTRTVLAQPVIIAFSHTDLKTGKDKLITNIGKDEKVDLVQVQILKELLDVSHGYLNLPKAPYAKISRAFNVMKEIIKLSSIDGKYDDDKENHAKYREKINNIKNSVSTKISTNEAVNLLNILQTQKQLIEKLDQGGYHAVYLAFEYIIANKKQGAERQDYSFIDLCEKCYPELVQNRDGKRYFNRGAKVEAFRLTLKMLAVMLSIEPAFGISTIEDCLRSGDYITVVFLKVKK